MTTARSVPRMIFSIALVKSLCSTAAWSRRAANRAASLTSSARSAPDMPGVDADDGLDELRRGDREERRVGLARDGAGQERLAGAGRPVEQHAARDARAEALVALGVLEEVDDLDQLVLRLVDAGHVVEGDPRRVL